MPSPQSSYTEYARRNNPVAIINIEINFIAALFSWKYFFPEIIAQKISNDRDAAVIIDADAKPYAKLLIMPPTPLASDCPKKIRFLKKENVFSFAEKYAMKKK